MKPQKLITLLSQAITPSRILKKMLQTDLNNPHFLRGLLIDSTGYKSEYYFYKYYMPWFTLNVNRTINLSYASRVQSGRRFNLSSINNVKDAGELIRCLDLESDVLGVTSEFDLNTFYGKFFQAEPELAWDHWKLRDYMITAFLLEDFSKSERCARQLVLLPDHIVYFKETKNDAEFFLKYLNTFNNHIKEFINNREQSLKSDIMSTYAV